MSTDTLWQDIKAQAQQQMLQEPVLASFLHATILNHDSLACAVSFHLAQKLESQEAPALLLREVIEQALHTEPSIILAIRADLNAVLTRDSACIYAIEPLLFFKGFHALQSYRISHWLWQQGRTAMALFFQNRISIVFGVDIHPAALIGEGIMFDHATGIVIGETAVIEDNVSIMQAVTLGGTGKESGDRHPKVRKGALIGAGAKILGNIEIGEGAKVAAGSVVLKRVKPHTTVAGVPAKAIGCPGCDQPALTMDQNIKKDKVAEQV